ncbi:MAG: hypothetical protein HY321_15405 [Armatimonadetes bacterium]|nr:hypothetical protein [Armatimonadota bacterium]
MARFKRGDRVAIVERETTTADRKSGRYYPHLSGLRGVVDQVYAEEEEVCVEVDLESLPPEFMRRHQRIEEQARQRWLESLSEQERRSLSSEQKALRLKYTVLVASGDLAPEGRRARPPAGSGAVAEARRSEAAAPPPEAPPGDQPAAGRERRPSETDLAAQEAAYLEELVRRSRRERA